MNDKPSKDMRVVEITVPNADIPLSEVPRIVKMLYPSEKQVSRQAVYQWVSDGVIGHDGKKLYLRCVRVNGRKKTKASWIRDFMEYR